jgi:hypothetical protein
MKSSERLFLIFMMTMSSIFTPVTVVRQEAKVVVVAAGDVVAEEDVMEEVVGAIQ